MPAPQGRTVPSHCLQPRTDPSPAPRVAAWEAPRDLRLASPHLPKLPSSTALVLPLLFCHQSPLHASSRRHNAWSRGVTASGAKQGHRQGTASGNGRMVLAFARTRGPATHQASLSGGRRDSSLHRCIPPARSQAPIPSAGTADDQVVPRRTPGLTGRTRAAAFGRLLNEHF